MRRFVAFLCALAIVSVWVSSSSTANTTLVALGSSWKYLDNGTDQNSAWRGLSFSDGSWPAGNAQLGYGDGDEITTVGFGPDPNNKYITTYFRQTFSVPDPSLYQSLTLSLLRDDGAVVYLNGTEVYRSNMPGGAIAFNTLASGVGEYPNYETASVNPALLQAGPNVLAVEIHQGGVTSSDISFDAQLVGSTSSLLLTRGPYLQTGTPSSIVVRWRTNAPSNSHVTFGPSVGNLVLSATDSTVTTEHIVTLSGLSANTRYYYAVGSTTETVAGGDANHSFVTSPPTGTSVPTRVWVLGDSGTADANAQAVRNAYYTFAGSTQPNLWLMLGDNAYESGLDTEYQAAVFNMYPQTLRQSVLWPTLGNHDGTAANSSNQSGPYYDMFTLPKAAEAGGFASGTEAYFSFDYGNIHFINLESFETDRSATGPMMTWLQNDVAATTQPWVVAFWHHPPYSKGSHNSDTETELVEMRQNALPILEAAGVDLVLSGHSHAYERSYLIDGHYGLSSTFSASMKKDGGSGQADGTGAYRKPTAGKAPHEGAVYTVAGSSGQISGGTLNHPAMFRSLNVLGSLVLDVDGLRLDAKFINNTGGIADYFTIIKGASAPTITTAALPDGTVGTPYSQTLAATGGTMPYTWDLAAGALPAGLTLNASTGVISGTPTTAGASSFTARVIDSSSPQQSATRPLSIAIAALPPPGAFGKSVPKNNAKSQQTTLTLSWAASSGAASYEYCVDTTNDNACAGAWVSTGTVRQAAVSGLAAKKAHYWQVRAVNAGGTTFANGGTWWKFTTR